MTPDPEGSRRVRVDYQDRGPFPHRGPAAYRHRRSAGIRWGRGLGPTPTELFVASLASCVAFYARRFAARHGIPTEGLAVTADFGMASHPSRVREVTLKIEVPGHLAPAQEAALLAVAAHCTVHNTLLQPPAVRIDLVALTPGAA